MVLLRAGSAVDDKTDALAVAAGHAVEGAAAIIEFVAVDAWPLAVV